MLTRSFPVLAILISILAFSWPSWLTPLKPIMTPLLGIIMFGMGVTLKPADFLRVFSTPWPVALGLLLQFGIMPAAGWLLAKLLLLPQPYLIGVVLLGACPGGTASNVICYLARGDVALSISLTGFSTLLAIFATPLLSWLYLGHSVDVPVQNMLLTILYVILLPVTLGVLINRYFSRQLEPVRHVSPAVSVAAIVFIIGIIVALNRDNIAAMAPLVLLAVVLHNATGLLAGYWLTRAAGQSRTVARTIAIEVGMQNSGLAVILAAKYFSAAAALPGAVFSIWHNLSGSVLAAYWSGGKTEKG